MEHTFELLDDLEHDGIHYLAVVPAGEDETDVLDDDLDLLIMKVTEQDGEEFLDLVEDDEELYEIGEIFSQRLAELYEIEVDDK